MSRPPRCPPPPDEQTARGRERPRSSPAASATSSSRTSAERPERPSRPDRWSRTSSSSASVARPSPRSARRIPGSIEPARVPIIRPSSGVIPIDVSTDRPPSTAVTEQPLPRWATTSRSPSTGRPRSSAARATDQATDRPWKPKRRMPQSRNQASGNRIAVAGRRKARVERGVERRHVGYPGQRLSGGPDRLDGDPSVERGELGELLDGVDGRILDQRWVDEARPAMNDPIADRVDRRPCHARCLDRAENVGDPGRPNRYARRVGTPLDRRCSERVPAGRLDDRRLERARARIEDEDAQRAAIGSSLELRVARHRRRRVSRAMSSP